MGLIPVPAPRDATGLLPGSLAAVLRSCKAGEIDRNKVLEMFVALGVESSDAMDRRVAYLCVSAIKDIVVPAEPKDDGGSNDVKDAVVRAMERMSAMGA